MRPITKKLMALVLALCLLIGMPFAVSAEGTNDYVTFKATLISQNASANTVTVRLKFSEPVCLNTWHVNLCNDIAPAMCANNVESGAWQLIQKTSLSSPRIDDATNSDVYTDTYEFTYIPCTDSAHTNHYSDWANGLPKNAIIRIVNPNLVSVFKSQSGKSLKTETNATGENIAWVAVDQQPVTVSASLISMQGSSAKIRLKFSEPVSLYVWRVWLDVNGGSKSPNTSTSSPVNSNNGAFIGTIEGNDKYSDTFDYVFDGLDLTNGLAANATIRIADRGEKQTQNEVVYQAVKGDGYIDDLYCRSVSGGRLKATSINSDGHDVVTIPVNQQPVTVSAKLMSVTASQVKIKLQFSEPVSLYFWRVFLDTEATSSVTPNTSASSPVNSDNGAFIGTIEGNDTYSNEFIYVFNNDDLGLGQAKTATIRIVDRGEKQIQNGVTYQAVKGDGYIDDLYCSSLTSGGRLKATSTDSNGYDVLSLPVDMNPIDATATLIEQDEAAITVMLKFSEPVALYYWRTYMSNTTDHVTSDNGTQYGTLARTSSQGPMNNSSWIGNNEAPDLYSDTYVFTFPQCTDASHAHYAANSLMENAVIRITDEGGKTKNDGNTKDDGYIGKAYCVGESGRLLKANATNANGEAIVIPIRTTEAYSWDDYTETEDTIVLENKTYNFMNTDTGREIAVNGADEFAIVRKSEGSNLIALKSGEQYVNLTTETPTLVDEPIYYLLRAGANERYQLQVNPFSVLADSDAGMDDVAHFSVKAANSLDISTGWYLTPNGEDRPLKVMPLGDSITFGVNPDIATEAYRVGYREQLSEALTEYLGRVVFVGSEKSKNNLNGSCATTINETRLLRHAGFPGYTANYLWPENNREDVNPGIADFVEDLTDKYTPDVVFLMLGTNDLFNIKIVVEERNGDLNALLNEWVENYETFIRTIEGALDQDGVVICSTIVPMGNSINENYTIPANEVLIPVLQNLEANAKVVMADNYTAIYETEDAISSDKCHLSVTGYAAMAEEYLKVFKGVDLQNSLNKNTTVVLTEDYTASKLVIPAAATLDLNGHILTADVIMAFGQVIDTAEVKGGIAIAKNDVNDDSHLLNLSADNAMMPLYDAEFGGYRFFTVDVTHLQRAGETSDSCKFGFQFDMDDQAMALLMDAQNADVLFSTKLTVTVGDTVYDKIPPYEFNAATLAGYADRVLNQPSTSKWTIVLTIWGINSLDGDVTIQSAPTMTSSTGVGVAGDAVTYVG